MRAQWAPLLLLLWGDSSAFQPTRPTSTFTASRASRRHGVSLSTCSSADVIVASEEESPMIGPSDAAAAIAASFVPSDYNPIPWLTNCHVQTIGGYLLRGIPECAFVEQDKNGLELVGSIAQSLFRQRVLTAPTDHASFQWDHRERIETNDGDWFHADSKHAEDDKATVILLHGFEASSESGIAKEMADAYHRRGMHVVCLNFRGCSGTPNDTLGAYHAGFTDDLLHYLELHRRRYPTKAVYLSGFSLGANAVVKALGDLGEEAHRYNIQGAAVACVPLDLGRNVKFLDAPGLNRALYSESFLKSVRQKAKEQLDRFCDGDEDTDRFDYRRAVKASTVAEFDDAYTAQIYGFGSNVDYYRRVSSAYTMDQIVVPTFILNAGDDPFFDPDFFPKEKSCEFGGRAPLKMVRTDHGGHLGFAFNQLDEVDLKQARSERRPSWAPFELSRFLDHVHDRISPQ